MEAIKVNRIESNSILIADDSKQIIALHSKYAQMACPDINIRTALDGAAAWELFQQNPSAVAMLDVEMPRLNGVQLAEKIHRNSPATGIIVFSGNLTQNIMLKFASLDVDFAKKPASQYDVAVKVRTALRQFEKEMELEKLKICAQLTSALNVKQLPLPSIAFLRDLVEDPKCVDTIDFLREAVSAGPNARKTFFSVGNQSNGKQKMVVLDEISRLDDGTVTFIRDLLCSPKSKDLIDLCQRVLNPPNPQIGRAISDCLYPERR